MSCIFLCNFHVSEKFSLLIQCSRKQPQGWKRQNSPKYVHVFTKLIGVMFLKGRILSISILKNSHFKFRKASNKIVISCSSVQCKINRIQVFVEPIALYFSIKNKFDNYRRLLDVVELQE